MAEKVFIIGTVNGEETVNEWPGTYAEAWQHIDGQSRQLALAGYLVRWEKAGGWWIAIKKGEVITVRAVQR